MEREQRLLEKNTFLFLFVLLALTLVLLPFLTTFNDFLTRFVIRLEGYRVIQSIVVPFEVRMVAKLLSLFGFEAAALGGLVAMEKQGEPFLIEIAWNCIGWQSLLFFLVTVFVGLQGGRYTNISKFKALAIGLLGTLLVNLVRIAVVALVAYYFGQNVAIIFHDYGSTLAVIGWLFFFWYFSYSFVLESKEEVG